MSATEDSLAVVRQLAQSWKWALETRQPEPHRIDVVLTSPDDLLPFVTALRVKRLGWLSAITGLDPGVDSGSLELLYHFSAGAAIITLRLRLPRDKAVVPTLCDVIPAAESSEREVQEMLGVTVQGLRTPERIYLPDGWPEGAYPLRKDFVPEPPAPEEGARP